MFLVAQIGLMAMLFLRFWQRGVEASLVLQHPVTTSDDSFPEPQGTYRRVTPITSNVPPPPAAANPDRPHHIEIMSNPDPLIPVYPPPLSQDQPFIARSPAPTLDPIPNPEPPSPSLAEPDPGVFHHDPVPPAERPDDDAQDKR
jgi:hypothetical protein